MTNVSRANVNSGVAVGQQGKGRESPSRFPAYPTYKYSGVEWLGVVPDHWAVTLLKRGYEVVLGKMLQPEARRDDDEFLPYLRAANIQLSGVDTVDVKRMWFCAEEKKSLLLRRGDLLVSEGGDVGRSAIWDFDDEECYFQNSINRIRSIGGNNTRFLYFWMMAIKKNGYIDVLCNKSTIAHFTAEKVAAVPLPIPTKTEQTQIARFLDHETVRIDALIEEQQRLIELLKEKRKAVISHAVTKGLDPAVPMKDSGVKWLGEIPAHWAIKRLKQLVIDAAGIQMGPFGGMLIDLDDSDTGYKVYGQENTISGNFTSGNRWVAESRYFALSNYHLEVGDIVLTRKGSLGNCRRVSLLPQAGIIDSDTIRVRVQEHMMNPDYLELLLHEAGYISTQLNLVKRGAILSGLNSEIIANLVIVAPPREDQEELLQKVRTASSKFDQGISDCEYAVGLLRERRSALISAAVTGKIDVRGWQSPANAPTPELAQEAV